MYTLWAFLFYPFLSEIWTSASIFWPGDWRLWLNKGWHGKTKGCWMPVYFEDLQNHLWTVFLTLQSCFAGDTWRFTQQATVIGPGYKPLSNNKGDSIDCACLSCGPQLSLCIPLALEVQYFSCVHLLASVSTTDYPLILYLLHFYLGVRSSEFS